MPRPLTPSPTSSRWMSRSPAYRLRNFTILEKFIFHFPTHLYVDSDSPSATHPIHQFISWRTLPKQTTSAKGDSRLLKHSRGLVSGYFSVVQKSLHHYTCRHKAVTIHHHCRYLKWVFSRNEEESLPALDTQYTFSIFTIRRPIPPDAAPPTPITTSFGNTLKWFQVFYHSVFSLLLCRAKLRNLFFSFSLLSAVYVMRKVEGKKKGEREMCARQMDDDLAKEENRKRISGWSGIEFPSSLWLTDSEIMLFFRFW